MERFSHLTFVLQLSSFFLLMREYWLVWHARAGRCTQLEVTSAFLPLRPRVVTSGLKKTDEKRRRHGHPFLKYKKMRLTKENGNWFVAPHVNLSFTLTQVKTLAHNLQIITLYLHTKTSVMLRLFVYVFSSHSDIGLYKSLLLFPSHSKAPQELGT